jgi:hypothetical protein
LPGGGPFQNFRHFLACETLLNPLITPEILDEIVYRHEEYILTQLTPQQYTRWMMRTQRGFDYPPTQRLSMALLEEMEGSVYIAEHPRILQNIQKTFNHVYFGPDEDRLKQNAGFSRRHKSKPKDRKKASKRYVSRIYHEYHPRDDPDPGNPGAPPGAFFATGQMA